MPDTDLRLQFLKWQCRIRQIAMREHQGRPSSGMTPAVLLDDGRELADAIATVFLPSDVREHLAFFKHQVRRTNDPREIRDKGLQLFQSTFFQHAEQFSDELTAVFSPQSTLAEALLDAERCTLVLEQFSQTYRLACHVRRLKPSQDAYQATLWHNRIFNPALSDDVTILGFKPDWSACEVG